MSTDFTFKPPTGALPGKDFEKQVTEHLVAAATRAEWDKVTGKPADLAKKLDEVERLAAQNPTGTRLTAAGNRDAVGYQRNERGWRSSATCLFPPSVIMVMLDTNAYLATGHPPFDIDNSENWTDPAYAAADTRKGKDCFIHLVATDDGKSCMFALAPTMTLADAADSRLIGGFHCLCADTGTIADHPLSGLKAGDILPMSLWDLWHCPACGPGGMVFDPRIRLWTDIYLTDAGGTGSFGAAIHYFENWAEFTELQARRGRVLPDDSAFTSIMSGSSPTSLPTAPVTAGGNMDTAGRRLLSDIGVEDGTRVLWHFLDAKVMVAGGSWNSGSGGPTARTENPGAAIGGRGCAAPKWS